MYMTMIPRTPRIKLKKPKIMHVVYHAMQEQQAVHFFIVPACFSNSVYISFLPIVKYK